MILDAEVSSPSAAVNSHNGRRDGYETSWLIPNNVSESSS